MAWRIHDQVIRVVIENLIPNRVTGSVWLAGRTEPLQLELEGNAWADLAGCVLTVDRPSARPGDLQGLATQQRGACGDLTASRKVKIPTVDLATWRPSYRGEPFPFVWGNGVYLEWFSERNGRVVIELSGPEPTLTISEPLWRLTPAEEENQHLANAKAMTDFLRRLAKSEDALHRDEAGPAPGDLEMDPSPRELNATTPLQRAAMLKEARELCNGMLQCGGDENLPPEVREQFWRHVVDFERLKRKTIRAMLAEDGFVAEPSAAVADDALAAQLDRIVRALVRRGIYIHSTNHLSDRELYTLLVERFLEEETEELPSDSGWISPIDVSQLGDPSDPDSMWTYFRFYADEAELRRWAAEFPNDKLPSHEDPPYDRDRWLPQAPV